jgi:hypothetical protein
VPGTLVRLVRVGLVEQLWCVVGVLVGDRQPRCGSLQWGAVTRSRGGRCASGGRIAGYRPSEGADQQVADAEHELG